MVLIRAYHVVNLSCKLTISTDDVGDGIITIVLDFICGGNQRNGKVGSTLKEHLHSDRKDQLRKPRQAIGSEALTVSSQKHVCTSALLRPRIAHIARVRQRCPIVRCQGFQEASSKIMTLSVCLCLCVCVCVALLCGAWALSGNGKVLAYSLRLRMLATVLPSPDKGWVHMQLRKVSRSF